MAKKTPHSTSPTQQQDWAVFGFRLVTLMVLTLSLMLTTRGGAPPNTQSLITASAASVMVNLILLVFLLVPSMSRHTSWVVMVGDWIVVGMYAWLVRSDAILMILVGSLALVSLVRLGVLWGSFNAMVSIGIFAAALVYRGGGVNSLQPLLPELTSASLVLVLLVVSLGTLVHLRQREYETSQTTMRLAAQEREAIAREMHERTVAITEMAQALNASLDYERVLDTALTVGRLALRDKYAGFLALVLLYRPEDRMLFTITGRGMARVDEGRIIRGRDGIVAETLRVCEPLFTGSVRHDAELGKFLTLNRTKSAVCVPLRAGYDNYGVMIFASNEPNAFNESYKTFLTAIGIQTTIALQNAVLYQDLANEKEHILEVEEEARKKLARDLHDGPTQTISAIAMRMGIIQKMMDKQPDKVPDELRKVEELARRTTSEIRHMMFTLRPLALESQGLNAALEQLAEKVDAIYDQKVEVIVSPQAEEVLTSQQGGALFYIIEEAINNARKHAKADVIRVRVSRYDNVVLTEIIDNGVGFDVQAVQDNYEGRTSLGMVNLRERTDMINGRLTIESAIGQGTTISVLVPITDVSASQLRKPGKLIDPIKKPTFKLSAIR